jgi:hypothetical protein
LLFRQGEVVPLVPKAIDTLHVLLEQRGRVVEKAELMKFVWPDTTVEEVGLARNISLLRKALDDESGQYIETIPRLGYRFAAEAPMQGPGAGETSVARSGCRHRGAGRNRLLAILCAVEIPAATAGERPPGDGAPATNRRSAHHQHPRGVGAGLAGDCEEGARGDG